MMGWFSDLVDEIGPTIFSVKTNTYVIRPLTKYPLVYKHLIILIARLL